MVLIKTSKRNYRGSERINSLNLYLHVAKDRRKLAALFFRRMKITKTFPLLLVFLSCTVASSSQIERKPLYIGGLFDIDTSQGGWNSGAIIPAVKMAFEDINNMTNVLPGYRLELLIRDVKVS